MEQTKMASEMGYFFTRTREAIEGMKFLMWSRIVPETLMILGGAIILYDLVMKTYFAKKTAA